MHPHTSSRSPTMSAIDISSIPEGDLRRFAACWLNSDLNTDWDAAHQTFDPEGKLKLASFKTVTQKASKKASGGGAAAAAANGENGDAAKPKKTAPKRKKAASEANGDNEGESKPKKSRAPAKKGKKEISEEKVVEDDEASVKGEEDDEV
ncbi:hypothetical protein BST61_g3520 [Cercospora zeina]